MARLRRRQTDAKRVLRKDRTGANPFKVGLAVLIVLSLGVYLGFAKDIPFTKGFEVRAVFESAVNIRPNSPVRIAGVDVGKVTKVEGYKKGDGNAALVTMEIKDEGLPIHKDATAKIRPRIFLEGNFFVDLSPGSPSAPKLSSGDTLPITQTSRAVQFDEVLTALQSDTREDLRELLEGYGTALTHEPTAAEDVDQDPDVQGKTAAEALNASIEDSVPALRGVAIVNEALLGLETHDLSKLIESTGKITDALSRHEQSLKDLVTNFNRTQAALADESSALRRSIGELGPTISNARKAATSINDALPDLRALALELIPGVQETPATIKASYPWIRQTRALLRDSELGGVVKRLRPTTADLAKLADENLTALPQADLVSQCITKVILPTGNIKIQDGPFTTGVENYKEFWYTVVGFAGEGQNFDGNGHYVRFASGGGDWLWATGPFGPSGSGNTAFRQFSRTNRRPQGTRPAYPGKQPPYNPNARCKDQPLPALNDAPTGPADGSGPGGIAARPHQQVQGATIQVPTTTGTAAASASSRSAKAGEGDDLATELIERLNPFRKEGSR